MEFSPRFVNGMEVKPNPQQVKRFFCRGFQPQFRVSAICAEVRGVTLPNQCHKLPLLNL